MDIKEKIGEAIGKSLQTLGISSVDFVIEHPEDISFGDYSTNVAMIVARQIKNNPKDIAKKIATELEGKIVEVEKIEIAGPGFINFYLKPDFFVENIKKILKLDKKYGQAKIGKGKKVLVEYSSPNIAKPFTVGHLRSTVIGDALANILSALGYKVIRDNHLGDWGTQFGKLLVAIEKWSSLDEIKKSQNPIKTLVDLYVKFHDEAEKDTTLETFAREKFKLLESGDKNLKKIWQVCVDLSNEEFKKIYKRLEVSFDSEMGESKFVSTKITAPVLKALNDKKLLKESEGAKVVFFEGDKMPPLIFEKSDGTSIYATRDLATDWYRKNKYGKDLIIINEVGSEQTLYFKQLYEVEKMLGWFNEGERVHISHGLYRFKEGKMSTRKGNVIWLHDILEEAVSRAKAINEESAELVGIGAIKFNDLRRESLQDIVFDWEQIINLKGDSGPYLQYTARRVFSILEKAKEIGIKESIKNSPKEITLVEKLLARYPEVVIRAGEEYSPHYIATYLLELASAFNAYYAQNKIIDSNDNKSPYKIALAHSVGIILTNGLNLLGIKVPDSM